MDYDSITLDELKAYFETLQKISPDTIDIWVDSFWSNFSRRAQ